jgi:hypothetical protein
MPSQEIRWLALAKLELRIAVFQYGVIPCVDHVVVDAVSDRSDESREVGIRVRFLLEQGRQHLK